MADGTKNLDTHHEAMSVIEAASRDLAYIAKALFVVGNERLADELTEMSAEIDGQAEKARHAFTSEIMGRYQDSQKAAGNMLEAALAGIQIAYHEQGDR